MRQGLTVLAVALAMGVSVQASAQARSADADTVTAPLVTRELEDPPEEPPGGSEADIADGVATLTSEDGDGSQGDGGDGARGDAANDGAADNGAGQQQGADSSSSTPAGSGDASGPPARRTVTQEEYNRLFDRCRTGEYRDNLLISCVAALPDVAEDADPSTPGQQQPQVTVAQVRQRAIAQIRMNAPDIGASPCLATPGACRGTVGVPVWLWVGDGTGSLPSKSATASAGRFTITATAKVSKVKWSLGDGQTTICTGVGSKYDAQRDGWASPACGFDSGWTQAGSYTLTASYVWEISWTGDDTGSATQIQSSTEQVTVGELQSVVTTG